MGLDTTHDCWHGPYTAFHSFRAQLARTVGMDLMDMKGYGGPRRWSELPEDRLHILLNHSDSDGEIPVADCIPLADRLEELAPLLTDEWARDKARQFAAGLREAAAAGENVEFH